MLAAGLLPAYRLWSAINTLQQGLLTQQLIRTVPAEVLFAAEALSKKRVCQHVNQHYAC